MRKSDLTQPYVKMLLYGVPGSYKTRTASSAALDPRSGPVLQLNVGGNPASISDYPQKPDVFDIESLTDFNQVYDWLAKGQPEGHLFVQNTGVKPGYKTVIVDTLTDVQRMSFNKVIGVAAEPGTIPKNSELQHFNSVLGHMVNFNKLFSSLPMHVIVTAQERTDKDEQTGGTMQAPFIWGQSMVEVCGYYYIVGRMVHRANMGTGMLKVLEDATGGQKFTHVMLLQPSGKYVAKDQYGKLGPFIAAPTMTRILDLIYGEATK